MNPAKSYKEKEPGNIAGNHKFRGHLVALIYIGKCGFMRNPMSTRRTIYAGDA